MEHMIEYTKREAQEIQHALYYAKYLAHGTVGHNMLMLIAKMAYQQGFDLTNDTDTGDTGLLVPSNIAIGD